MSERLSVIIAEDHYLVREGTRQLLESSGSVDVVAAVGTVEELYGAVRRLHPQAVLTDIRMPPRFHMEGIEAAHRIRAEYREIGVVVLSQHADEAYAFELLKNGTDGLAYLLKDRVADLEDVVAALRAVSAGRSVIDPRVVDALVARRARLSTSPLALLTPRELEVLGEMAQGKSNVHIASQLSLSESAIEKAINAIFNKLGLTQETQLHRRVAAVLTFLRESAL